jgi:hypothetical protein
VQDGVPTYLPAFLRLLPAAVHKSWREHVAVVDVKLVLDLQAPAGAGWRPCSDLSSLQQCTQVSGETLLLYIPNLIYRHTARMAALQNDHAARSRHCSVIVSHLGSSFEYSHMQQHGWWQWHAPTATAATAGPQRAHLALSSMCPSLAAALSEPRCSQVMNLSYLFE